MSSQHLEACPVGQVICKKTGAFVGWLYRWNTGEYGTLWQGPKLSGDVEYRTIAGQITQQAPDNASPDIA